MGCFPAPRHGGKRPLKKGPLRGLWLFRPTFRVKSRERHYLVLVNFSRFFPGFHSAWVKFNRFFPRMPGKGMRKNTLKTPWEHPETPWKYPENPENTLKFMTFSTFSLCPLWLCPLHLSKLKNVKLERNFGRLFWAWIFLGGGCWNPGETRPKNSRENIAIKIRWDIRRQLS